MKVICAWCSALLSDDGVDDGKPPSHGICDECTEAVLRMDNEANAQLDKSPCVGPVRGTDPRD